LGVIKKLSIKKKRKKQREREVRAIKVRRTARNAARALP